jgi:hypothetical protein
MKMCEFCKNENLIMRNLYEQHYIVKQNQKAYLIFLYDEDNGYAEEIQYCPMCGRKL